LKQLALSLLLLLHFSHPRLAPAKLPRSLPLPLQLRILLLVQLLLQQQQQQLCRLHLL
jgi:hypothetical protein